MKKSSEVEQSSVYIKGNNVHAEWQIKAIMSHAEIKHNCHERTLSKIWRQQLLLKK